MKKKAFFISDSLPDETHGGGNVTALNIASPLKVDKPSTVSVSATVKFDLG